MARFFFASKIRIPTDLSFSDTEKIPTSAEFIIDAVDILQR